MGDKCDSNFPFREEFVSKLLQLSFKDEKTKLNHSAVTLAAELLRIFVTEATMRAAKRVSIESGDSIESEHMEKILPQLLLDFA